MGLYSLTPEEETQRKLENDALELLREFKYNCVYNKDKINNWKEILTRIACFMRQQDKKQEWYNFFDSTIVKGMLQEMKDLYNKNKNKLSEEIQQLVDNWFSHHSNTFSRWNIDAKCTFKQDIPQYLIKMITRPQRYNSNYSNLRY